MNNGVMWFWGMSFAFFGFTIGTLLAYARGRDAGFSVATVVMNDLIQHMEPAEKEHFKTVCIKKFEDYRKYNE